MCKKGSKAGEIVLEINKKLSENLPAGVFCAASMYCIDLNLGAVEFFNGSIPGAFILRKNKTVEDVPSKNIPLGIAGPDDFIPVIHRYNLEKGDKIYLFTDGVVEIENNMNEKFGIDRLKRTITSKEFSDTFSILTKQVEIFASGLQDDDITFLEYTHKKN